VNLNATFIAQMAVFFILGWFTMKFVWPPLMKDGLRDQVAALAVAGAEKILRREVNAQAHADLLGQLRQDLR
jgi:F-type H+-transporting ATPase subunit b